MKANRGGNADMGVRTTFAVQAGALVLSLGALVALRRGWRSLR
jgi:hypothetical protein